ncbi:uncharacterized protein [Onthophagus taurus]|uniref:uncharacterized protein n=1 Tax=Onthophagus taurus TaxID=166361 RepID=UPI0039BEA5BB
MEQYVRSNLVLVRERSSFNNFHDTMSAFMIAFLFYSLMYFLFAQNELFAQFYVESDTEDDVYSEMSRESNSNYEYMSSSLDYELFEEHFYENLSFNTDSDADSDEIDMIYNNRHSTPIELSEEEDDSEENNQESDEEYNEVIENDETEVIAAWFSNLLPHQRFALRNAILNAVLTQQGFGLNIINTQTVTTPYGVVEVTQELYHYLLYEGNDFNGNPRFDPFSDFF